MTGWLGVDFGTSNTAAAVLRNGAPVLLPLESGKQTLPTALFLDYAARRTLYGSPAIEALVSGREGRFMRALKRVLGTPLMREPRQLMNRRATLIDVVAEFLTMVRTRAEAAADTRFRRVVAGRPVHFHDDPARDTQAVVDLAEAYALAGFDDIVWMPEPEAAARASGVTDGLGLVVDIGGGTSDFTLFAARGGTLEMRASHGRRIGGTDADRALSLAHVMPRLGMGATLRAEFGDARLPAPAAPFQDLATWEKIAFLQTPDMLREARRWHRVADAPDRIARLVAVLEHALGFDVAFAVERAKIAATEAETAIDLTEVEPGLAPPLRPADLTANLAAMAEAIARAARGTLDGTGTAPADITHIVHVGGSSLLPPVRRAIAAAFPQAAPVKAAAFTAVAAGLAIAASDRD